MSTQSERIAALEVQCAALEAALEAAPKLIEAALRAALNTALVPLADEVKRAHARIDHAGDLFKDMRRALTPKTEPARVARAAFDAALAELRSDAGNDRAFFARDVILERAARRAQLARQTEAAGA